ncbi:MULTISPECIES: TonB-dependent receptor [unclassified Phenylobacterium]|uniref:TonB-dependent receptor n=1 Tax=unclassified Phenylobacterium TaxID=2640670 RepID=UPI00083AAB0F|nr:MULTISPECIES: TonB-dependent receptor [unclassified Phenylobacterium]
MHSKFPYGNQHRRRARLLLLCAAPAALLWAAPALAADDGQTTALEEVIVTARKREENIREIPVAVTAISQEKLDRYELRSIEAIAASIPQLSVVRGSSGSGATISLRGIGSTFTSIGIEQSVAVILDGVYYGQGRIINEGFFDMKQVEVLRGPQALFFGKNATAGVLSFTSADPGESFEALGRVGYEFKGQVANLEGVVSGPVTDTLGLRLAVRYSDMRDGYVTNEAPARSLTTLNVATGAVTVHPGQTPVRDLPGERDLAVRLTALWRPSEEFSLNLKGSLTRYRTENATWNNETIRCPVGGFTQVNPTEACNANRRIQQNPVPADIAATNPLLGRHGGQLYQDYDAYSVSAAAAYSTGKADITSVTGLHHFTNWFLGDYDFTGAADGGTWGSERSEYKAFSEEIRAQTTLEFPINVMVGVYFQSTRLDFDQQIIFPGALEDSTAADPTKRYITVAKRSYTDGRTFAGFAQLQWKFTPELELTAGARYTHETKDSQFVQPYVIAPFQPVFRQNRPILADQSFNDLSPELTLTWKPADNWTAFASYKQGFKSGGFSGSALDSAIGNTTVNDLAFQPESAEGFEAGVRGAVLNGRLRFSIDAYTYKYSDLQVDYFDATRIQYITQNAGSSRSKGVETEVEWAPAEVPGLVLRAALAYNRARYIEFAGAPCWGGQRPVDGCTIVGGRSIQDLGGKPTALAPKWTGALEANYERPVGGGLVFGASANLRYSSSYLGNPFGNPASKQDSYATLDAAIRLKTRDNRWEVALLAKNLTDEYVVYNVSDAPSSGSGTGTAAGIRSDSVATPNLPRTVALQLTWKY